MLPEFGVVEMLVIGAIALIVVGPKDLPILMRRVGKFIAQARNMAAEFRSSFDEMARQAELDELRKEVEAMRLSQADLAAAASSAVGLDGVVHEIDPGLADRLVADENLVAQHPVAASSGPEPAPAAKAAKPKAAAKPKTTSKSKPAPKAATTKVTAAKPKASAKPKAAAKPAKPRARSKA